MENNTDVIFVICDGLSDAKEGLKSVRNFRKLVADFRLFRKITK